MESIRFLHVGDLHLGNYQYSNHYRAQDMIRCFQDILLLAETHHVDCILLAGDVFDSGEILPYLFSQIVSLLQNFHLRTNNEIPILAIEGNHDKRKWTHGQHLSPMHVLSWVSILDQLQLIRLLELKSKTPPIRIKDTYFYGIGYCGQEIDDEIQDLAVQIPRVPNTRNVLIMHVGIAGKMDGVPGIKLSSMSPLQKKIDYLGLGHFHLQFECDGWIFNPGSTEINASIENQFTRGIYMVDFGSNPIIKTIKHLILPNRQYLLKNIVLCSSLTTFEDVLSFILAQLLPNSIISDFNIPKEDRRVPVLTLMLKGGLIWELSDLIQKKLRNEILQFLNVVDVKIYAQIHRVRHSLDNFLYTSFKDTPAIITESQISLINLHQNRENAQDR